MKTDLFQSCGHCWVFQICWHIECSTFTASSFRIWNSSAGIPSPPLALFVVMQPKAHLTSHSRMSGSRWVITPPLWLSGSWRSVFNSSSVYSCHLFLISSAFLSFPQSVSPIRKLPQASYLYLSDSRQNENHNHRKLIKLHGSQPCLTQWNYELCHVGPPKTDGSWWRVLTKHGPLEKGMANHFSILALRTPWTVWKGI